MSSPVTKDTLNALMEFDHVIEVHADGAVTENPAGVYAPELYGEEVEESSGWVLLTGYTRQHGYRGPLLHRSEYVGGGLADDILANPGLYVTLISMCGDCDVCDSGDTCEPAEWAVAYRPTVDIKEATPSLD